VDPVPAQRRDRGKAMSNDTPVTLAELAQWIEGSWHIRMEYGPVTMMHDRGRRDAMLALLRASAAKEDVWRPIETAPKDGTRVILGWPGGGVRYGFYLDNSRTSPPWAGWRGPSMELPFPSPPPTHWQPLPAPPSAAPGEAKQGKPVCKTCGGSSLIDYDDAHGEPRNAPCPDCAPSPEQQGAEP
jgi:hypothetical protein